MAQSSAVNETRTEQVARERWIPFLDEFTRENRGAHAKLQVLGVDAARYVEVEDRPFDGVDADVKDGEDAVWIHFGSGPDDHLAHGIERVTAIRARTASGSVGAALEIESADSTRTLLELSLPADYALPPAEGR